MEALTAWVAEYRYILVAVSLISLIVGMLMIPLFVTRIPQDYFLHQRRPSPAVRHPLLRLLLTGSKNLLGAILVLAGILMLFLPGQGLLTLLIGLMIMNYPGKFTLECWLIRRPHVLPAINWLRRKKGCPPLLPPQR